MEGIKSVVLELSDDVVNIVECPRGVRVVVRDYDIGDDDDPEEVSIDASGRRFVEFFVEHEPGLRRRRRRQLHRG